PGRALPPAHGRPQGRSPRALSPAGRARHRAVREPPQGRQGRVLKWPPWAAPLLAVGGDDGIEAFLLAGARLVVHDDALALGIDAGDADAAVHGRLALARPAAVFGLRLGDLLRL